MRVFNTFSSGLRHGSIPIIDILIWTASLIRYRDLGYSAKLYCMEKEVPFLKDWHLFSLYDEIDTSFFDGNEYIKKTNPKKFWSTRKIEAIHNELSVLKNDSIYSDTDIIMRKKFDLGNDVLLWCPEESDGSKTDIYAPWEAFSVPKGYSMPSYIKEAKGAYNCGIMRFRNPFVFEMFRNEYYAFAIDNPCEINPFTHGELENEDLIFNNNVWACNAEQRILKGVLTAQNQKVGFVMNIKRDGWSPEATHYFYYRAVWRHINAIPNPTMPHLLMLNLTVLECMRTIQLWCAKHCDFSLFELWDGRPEVDGWRDVDAKAMSFPIKRYL